MTVKSIVFEEEVDNTPDALGIRGELFQDETYTNLIIYKVINTDGSEQFFKMEEVHDSYGNIEASPRKFTPVSRNTKIISVWE